MNETLQEYVDSRGLAMQIDRTAGIIRGVKVLGLESRNKRRYLPQALREAMPLYDGAKVNVNHAKGRSLAPRDYQDRIGVIREVRFEPHEGLFADLHFNPKHNLAEQLLWDAQHAPENVGLSHNVQARTKIDNGQTLVEAISTVYSVDLVADPATTQGLFEELGPGGANHALNEPILWSDLTAEALTERRPDLVEQLLGERDATLQQLQEQLADLQAAAAHADRRLQMVRLLEERGLPSQPTADGVVTQRFLESLAAAPNEQVLRELIADRARLVREARWWHGLLPATASGPKSRDQFSVDHSARVSTTEDFVRAIT